MTMKRKSIPSQLLLSNFFAYFFPNISIFISIVCLHMHEKNSERKVSKQSGAASSVLALFFQSSSCLCPRMSIPSFQCHIQQRYVAATLMMLMHETPLETNMASAGQTASETSSCDCLQFALRTSDTDLGVSYHRRMRVQLVVLLLPRGRWKLDESLMKLERK